MTDELKPCPFCGGSARYFCTGLDERFGYADLYKISCAHCSLSISVMDDQNPKGGYALNGTGKSKAFQRWNTRAEAAEERIEELEAKLAKAVEHIEWFISEDETNRGDEPIDSLRGQTWNEVNAYWLYNLDDAIAFVERLKGEKDDKR